MAEGFRCELVAWPTVEAWVASVIAKMATDGFRPDIVIAMVRGGMVPARLICDHLVVKSLYSVKTEHWGLTATPDGKAKLAQTLNTDVKGKRVLVVDDITDTGQSLILARDHVNGLGPGTLKTATMLHIAHSLITPDYFARAVPKDEWAWFIFPWNVREDLRNIVPKALEDPLTLPELRDRLRNDFKIDPGEPLLKETLAACVGAGTLRTKGGKWVAKES
jgi:hypoxanthine phosphoribosyltransferase